MYVYIIVMPIHRSGEFCTTHITTTRPGPCIFSCKHIQSHVHVCLYAVTRCPLLSRFFLSLFLSLSLFLVLYMYIPFLNTKIFTYKLYIYLYIYLYINYLGRIFSLLIVACVVSVCLCTGLIGPFE